MVREKNIIDKTLWWDENGINQCTTGEPEGPLAGSTTSRIRWSVLSEIQVRGGPGSMLIAPHGYVVKVAVLRQGSEMAVCIMRRQCGVWKIGIPVWVDIP